MESFFFQFVQVNYLEYNNVELKESAWCTIPFNEESNGSLYMMLGSTIIYFFAPLIIVTLLYSKYVDVGVHVVH